MEHMSWSTSEALSFGKIWRQRFLKRFVTGTRTAGGCEGVYCSFIPTRGASSALLVPSEVRPCETKSPEETSFVELEHACRPHVFSMQPPFRPRVCSLQPVLHPTDEMDETMYDETTTTTFDTFINEVGGELAAIGDSSGHARGDMLQVRQDEHMRDEMRSEMDSGITLADTAMTSAGAQDPSAPSQDSQDSQECVVPGPPPLPLAPCSTPVPLVPCSTPLPLVPCSTPAPLAPCSTPAHPGAAPLAPHPIPGYLLFVPCMRWPCMPPAPDAAVDQAGHAAGHAAGWD